MNSSEEFWTQQYRWPRDTEGYVFLARAVHQVGKHLFGDKWHGDEPAGRAGRPVEEEIQEWASNRGFAGILITADLKAASESERLRRSHTVQQTIAEWCARGALKGALRPYHGGELVSLNPAAWNTEFFWSRFNECRMHGDDPFNMASPRPTSPAAYIFVARDDLDRLIAPAPQEHPRDRIAGPFDEPQDGTMSLHDLFHWIIMSGYQQPHTEVANDDAIRRAERVIAAAHREGRITLLGICIDRETAASLGRKLNAGPALPIPPEYLIDPVFRFVSNQIGYGGPGSPTAEWLWSEVRVAKAEARREWPLGAPFEQSSAAAQHANRSAPKKTRPRSAAERIEMAVKAQWPDANLSGISAKDRDRKINDWLKRTSHNPVGDRTIRRMLAKTKRP